MPDLDQDSANPEAVEQEAMQELRQLLFGQEREELTEIRQRLDDPELKATDVSDVLPLAVRLRLGRDDQLGDAMAPAVEASLRILIARNLKEIADALYPVIGPAIRRSISASLQHFVDSTNRVIEQTFTLRGVKWRLEAWRTGLPVAEVALRHCLIYRVEQVFLINGHDGLPLEHATRAAVSGTNQDLMAGMLTAIQDFVRDSFGSVEEGGELDAFSVGELSVVVEQGPRAVLAAVVRGSVPGTLRERLQERSERIHAEFASALSEFDGDASRFESCRPILEDLLDERLREGAKPSAAPVWILVVLVALLFGGWGWSIWDRRQREQAFVQALGQADGVSVVTHERRSGRLRVRALWDPLASVDLDQLAESHQLQPGSVELVRVPYQALDSSLVLARARMILAPPPGVELTLSEGGLHCAGEATHAWIERARLLSAALPGVSAFVDAGLVDEEQRDYDALALRLALVELRYHPGSASLTPESAIRLDELARELARLRDLGRAVGRVPRLELVPGVSADPPTRLLSRARFDLLVGALGAPGQLPGPVGEQVVVRVFPRAMEGR